MIEELPFDARADRSYISADGPDRISLYSPSIFYSSVAQTATRERKKGSRVTQKIERTQTQKNPSGIITLSVTSCSISASAVSAFIQDELQFRESIIVRQRNCSREINNFRQTDIYYHFCKNKIKYVFTYKIYMYCF